MMPVLCNLGAISAWAPMLAVKSQALIDLIRSLVLSSRIQVVKLMNLIEKFDFNK